VYDAGSVYTPDVLDMTVEELRKRFLEGVANIAAISLDIAYPTKAAISHMVANAFKNLLSIAAVSDVTFTEAEKVYL
jgi:large subunit ribosomal protein LP0